MALLQISEPGQSTAPHRHNLACAAKLIICNTPSEGKGGIPN